MNIIKICNRCKELFNDDSLQEFTSCPDCNKGEIVFFNEEEYLKICADDKVKDDFETNLIEYGSPDSQRQLKLNCTFYKQDEAEAFIEELESKTSFHDLIAIDDENNWIVTGFTDVILNDIPKIIEDVEDIINKYNTLECCEWISIYFED